MSVKCDSSSESYDAEAAAFVPFQSNWPVRLEPSQTSATFSRSVNDSTSTTDRVNIPFPPRGNNARGQYAHLRDLVESIPDAMIIVDSSGQIQQVNDAAEAMFGYARSELLGLTVEVLVPVADRAAHIEHRRAYMAAPRRRRMGEHIDLAGQRKNGTTFPVDVSLTHMETPEGMLAVAYVRDMTERKRIERDLLLTQLVAAREDERLRIASDIHDDTLQSIAAVGMRVQMLARQFNDQRLVEGLETLNLAVQEAASRLRRLILELRPPGLESDGLAVVMRAYLEHIHAATGVEFELDVHLEREPLMQTRIFVYRIFQEALTDVGKQPPDGKILVSLDTVDGGCRVCISHGGLFEKDQSVEKTRASRALTSIRERIEMAHGHMTLTTGLQGEPLIEFWLPDEESFPPALRTG